MPASSIRQTIVRLKAQANGLKREAIALYFAVRDPRCPLPAKIVAGLVVAYALCPIDLIPDFIPVLGYLDDLILVPLGIALALRLIPPAVLSDARREADARAEKPRSIAAAVAVVAVWVACAALLGAWGVRALAR